MFVCVAAQNDEDGTDYKSYCLSAAQFGIRLTDDKISDFINIMNGFSTYYKAGGAGANEEYEKLVEVMQQGEAIARSKRGVVDED
jgi:hypothetical protein